ncbi:MAG TPA: hypothetical protein VGH28_17090 [Polyangiaceae bacterium]|jgi:hypothetical protein
MKHEEIARLKLDVALARALLDEVERVRSPDPRVLGHLVEELGRVVDHLAVHLEPTESGIRLRETA